MANSTTGGLTLSGSGNLTLSGSNTYLGATTVSGGTLTAGVASLAGSYGAFGLNSALVLANSAGVVVNLAGYNTQIGSLTGGGPAGGNVVLGAATLTVGGDNTSPPAYAGVISGSGGLTKIGSGLLILTGSNTYSGGTSINAGTLQIGAGGATGSIVNASTGSVSVASQALLAFYRSDNYGGSFASTIGGQGGVLLSGGSLTLTAYNSYTGGTTVNAGTLQTSAGSTATGAIGDSTSIAVNNGGVIAVGGNNSFVGSAISPSNTIQINSGGAIVNSGSSSNHLDALVLNGGTLSAVMANSSSGNWSFDQGVSTPGNALTSFISGGNAILYQVGGTVFNVGSGDTLTVSAVLAHLTGVSDTGLIKSGPGTLTLTGSNTYAGGTTVGGGTLVVNGALGNTAVSVGTGALMTVGAAGTVGNGGVTVGAGTLNVAGTLGTGAVNINGGALLTGAGTIGGPVTVASGLSAPAQGAINLVDGTIDTLTLTNTGTALTLGVNSGTAAMDFDISGSTTADVLALTGSLNVAEPTVINFTETGATIATGTYNLITSKAIETGSGAFQLGTVFTATGSTTSLASLGLTGSLTTSGGTEQLIIGYGYSAQRLVA